MDRTSLSSSLIFQPNIYQVIVGSGFTILSIHEYLEHKIPIDSSVGWSETLNLRLESYKKMNCKLHISRPQPTPSQKWLAKKES